MLIEVPDKIEDIDDIFAAVLPVFPNALLTVEGNEVTISIGYKLTDPVGNKVEAIIP